MMNPDVSVHNPSAVRAETPIPGTLCVRGYRNTLYGRKAAVFEFAHDVGIFVDHCIYLFVGDLNSRPPKGRTSDSCFFLER